MEKLPPGGEGSSESESESDDGRSGSLGPWGLFCRFPLRACEFSALTDSNCGSSSAIMDNFGDYFPMGE